MIVAILTPRAGIYNHRWIVAEKHGSNLEILLSQWLESLKSDGRDNPDKAHGILLSYNVTQANGRAGEEFVFLYDENFGTLASKQREELLKQLTDWRSRNIDELVREVGETSGNDLICVKTSVGDLQKDLDSKVPKPHRGFPKTKVEKLEEEKKKTEANKKSSWKWGCVLVVLTLIGCGIWAGIFSKERLHQFMPGNPTNGSEITEEEKEKLETLREWARNNYILKNGESISNPENEDFSIISGKIVSFTEINDWKNAPEIQIVHSPDSSDASLHVLSSNLAIADDWEDKDGKTGWKILERIDPVQFQDCAKSYWKYQTSTESYHSSLTWKIWDDSTYRLCFFVDRNDGTSKPEPTIMKEMIEFRETLEKNGLTQKVNELKEKPDSKEGSVESKILKLYLNLKEQSNQEKMIESILKKLTRKEIVQITQIYLQDKPDLKAWYKSFLSLTSPK